MRKSTKVTIEGLKNAIIVLAGGSPLDLSTYDFCLILDEITDIELEIQTLVRGKYAPDYNPLTNPNAR